jgi:type IV secretion system protein TrbL
MTSGIFDDITRAFLTALEGGTLSLGAYSLPLLGAFALIGWYWSFGHSLAMGGGQMGDALAGALLYAVNIGVAYWLLVNLSGMATAAYQTFPQWGLAAGGSATSGLLLTPSAVVDLGVKISQPLIDYSDRQMGWSAMWNMPKMLLYILAAVLIIGAFPLVAVALMVTQIEYHLAVLVGAVLIPFGVFGPTTFLTEFCIGWIVGCLLRVLVTAVLVGIGFPLFSTAVIALTDGNDPTLYSAFIVAFISLLYAWMTWSIPNKAATMCGRVALGLSASSVVSAAMGAGGAVVAGVQAVRGVSQMIQGRRA